MDTILTDAKGAAVGISGADKDGNTVVVNAKSVVLATGGVHGANRLGGTVVADFVVFDRIAGDSAAAYASAQ